MLSEHDRLLAYWDTHIEHLSLALLVLLTPARSARDILRQHDCIESQPQVSRAVKRFCGREADLSRLIEIYRSRLAFMSSTCGAPLTRGQKKVIAEFRCAARRIRMPPAVKR